MQRAGRKPRPAPSTAGQEREPGARERLVDAAAQLMAERQVLSVSLAEIGALAGANPALVSYYFGGREGLLLALMRRDAAFALAQMDRLLAADLPADEKLRLHVRGVARVYYQRPYLTQLLRTLLHDGSPTTAEEVTSVFVRPLSKGRRQLFREAMDAGVLRPIDPALVEIAIDGACDAFFMSSTRTRAIGGVDHIDEGLYEAYARSTTDLILHGMLRTPS